jgi:predicted nucleotidyltransferase component of viral defense system
VIDASSTYFGQARLLFRVLPLISQEQALVLKGGTAINMFVRDMPRLSVDADLIFMPLLSRQESLRAISDALGRIEANIKARIPGSTIRRHQLGREPYCVKLTIINTGVQVTAETAPVLRGTVFPPTVMSPSLHTQEMLGFAEMTIASLPDLYGGKICAALDRQHPRDLFDIKILFENEGITDDIRKAFVVYLAGHDRPMSELLAPRLIDIRSEFDGEFQGMTDREVTYDELLSVRERLISTIAAELTNEERHFLVSMKTGEPQWDLLGIEGIDRLPALQWKLTNIHKMDNSKHLARVNRLKEILQL